VATTEAIKSIRIWIYDLSPGISYKNFYTYLYASLISIALFSAMGFLQPYVLNANLGIPRAQQGLISGNLGVLSEIVTLFLIKPFGSLSDRIGRVPVLIIGVLALGLGYAFYPTADTLNDLYISRSIWAVGAAAAASTLAAITTDIPQNHCRGKLIGAGNVFNNIGILMVTLGLSQIPLYLMDNGTDARRAGQVAYWVLSSFCLLSTYIFYKGFDGPVLSKPSVSKKDIKFLDLLTNGFMEAKNPRILLAYIVSLTARADLTLKGTYIALWAVQSGMTQGFSPAKAMQQAGFVFGFMMVIGIITHFSWGFFFDRVNRVTATAVSMFFGAAGYMSMYFVPSPLDFNYLPFFALLSIGSATSIAVSIGLSGQESSPQNRGSIMGMIGLFGAVGIMITQFIGGRLFDAWGPSWPFIIVGIFQAFIMIMAIIVRILAPGGREGKQKLAKNI